MIVQVCRYDATVASKLRDFVTLAAIHRASSLIQALHCDAADRAHPRKDIGKESATQTCIHETAPQCIWFCFYENHEP
jgi:hypothetical protein